MDHRLFSIFRSTLLLLVCQIFLVTAATAGNLGVWDGVMSDDPSEEHSYTFTTEQDGTVTFVITMAPTMVSQYASISIIDANGEYFGKTYLTQNPKTVSYQLAPGDFSISISKGRSDIYGEYSIDAEFSAAGPNVSESENNDALTTATAMADTIVYGAIGYTRTKETYDNSDFYQIDLPGDGELTITVTSPETLTSTQNTILGIYDPAGNRLDYGFINETSENVTFRLTEGTYYLRMYLTLQGYYGGYALEFDHVEAINDSLETEINDDFSRADPVYGRVINGAIGYNREEISDERDIDVEDWFEFEFEGGDATFKVTVPESLASSNTTFSVFDSTGSRIDFMYLSTTEKTLNISDLDSGTYYISVYISRWGSYWGGYTIGISGTSTRVNISGMDLNGGQLPEANTPFTVTADAAHIDGYTLYYKFYYRANYGTVDYDTSTWNVVQDYSTSDSAQFNFSEDGDYIIVIRAVTDPNNESTALPIVGQAITVGNPGKVFIDSLYHDAVSGIRPNVPVTFTVQASTESGDTIYYQFYYCANYGTSDYETTPWTKVRSYTTDNTCSFTFPTAGDYIVVVRAVTDPENEPASLPIIGCTVNVN